jgi:hypothetical protein
MPTAIMNVCGATGSSRTANGERYASQLARRFVNLSSPATIGTTPKVSRSAQ